jgi:hypothetical protein
MGVADGVNQDMQKMTGVYANSITATERHGNEDENGLTEMQQESTTTPGKWRFVFAFCRRCTMGI